jgi:ethanolamine ammonia-lyase large subunit
LAEFTPEFITTIPNLVPIRTLSKDRNDYIAHPTTGEMLSRESLAALQKMKDAWGPNPPRGQIVISDGLNANAIMDQGHLSPYLEEMLIALTSPFKTVGSGNIAPVGSTMASSVTISAAT